jgi:hypothetical protein
MGYHGRAVEWIKAQLGWTVEIVKRPSKWGRYPADAAVDNAAATVGRRAHVRVDRSLPADKQRLRVPN